MAGDWIPIETSTPDKPEVLVISARAGIQPETVVGYLVRIWSWAQAHSSNGEIVTPVTVMRNALHLPDGFTEAMVEVGWLVIDNESILFPNASRWISKGSKARQLNALRQERWRDRNPDSNAKSNGRNALYNAPTEEKSTEEKSINTSGAGAPAAQPVANDEKSKPDESKREPNPIWDTVAAIWWPEGVPEPHRKRVGKIVRDLKSLGATEQEIITRRNRHLQAWPKAECTPESLVKHWHRFSDKGVAEDEKRNEPKASAVFARLKAQEAR